MKKNFFIKCLSLFVGFLSIPLFALAQQYGTPINGANIFSTSFGKNNAYTLTATFNGNVNSTYSNIGFNPQTGSFKFEGVDPNSTVTFNMKANVGSQEGLYVVSRDLNGNLIKNPDGLMGSPGEATFKVSELQGRTVEGRGLAQPMVDGLGRESANSGPLKTQPLSQGNNSSSLPFVGEKPQDQPSDSSFPYGSQQNPKSPSDKPSTGGSGASNNDALVPCDGVDCTLQMLLEMGSRIYNYLAGFGAILAVGAIVLAGFSYITSQGDSKKMGEAKQKIVVAIIGLVILGASVVLVNTVLKVMGAKITVQNASSSGGGN